MYKSKVVDGVNYSFRICDTGGLHRTDEGRLQALCHYLSSRGAESFNLLIFVIRQGGYYTRDARQDFENIMSVLHPQVAEISALVSQCFQPCKIVFSIFNSIF